MVQICVTLRRIYRSSDLYPHRRLTVPKVPKIIAVVYLFFLLSLSGARYIGSFQIASYHDYLLQQVNLDASLQAYYIS